MNPPDTSFASDMTVPYEMPDDYEFCVSAADMRTIADCYSQLLTGMSTFQNIFSKEGNWFCEHECPFRRNTNLLESKIDDLKHKVENYEYVEAQNAALKKEVADLKADVQTYCTKLSACQDRVHLAQKTVDEYKEQVFDSQQEKDTLKHQYELLKDDYDWLKSSYTSVAELVAEKFASTKDNDLSTNLELSRCLGFLSSLGWTTLEDKMKAKEESKIDEEQESRVEDAASVCECGGSCGGSCSCQM